MIEQIASISIVISCFAALFSALSAFFALRAARLSMTAMKSKEGKIDPGPDVEDVTGEHGFNEEVDQ